MLFAVGWIFSGSGRSLPAAGPDVGDRDRRLIVPVSQSVRPHDGQSTDAAKQHLALGGRGSRPNPVAGDGYTLGTPERTDAEGLLIDQRNSIVGAQPDVVL